VTQPRVIALAGPNGAGKSTTGRPLLQETLGVTQFVDADLIASGLSLFEPERAAFSAGKVMLARIKELAASKVTFAFETTLAGRWYAAWIPELAKEGYSFHLIFLYLPSPEFALERVADRVRRGGHRVVEATVRRRFHAGLRNFFSLYRPLAAEWRMYDNSGAPPHLVASGRRCDEVTIEDEVTWNALQRSYGGDDVR